MLNCNWMPKVSFIFGWILSLEYEAKRCKFLEKTWWYSIGKKVKQNIIFEKSREKWKLFAIIEIEVVTLNSEAQQNGAFHILSCILFIHSFFIFNPCPPQTFIVLERWIQLDSFFLSCILFRFYQQTLWSAHYSFVAISYDRFNNSIYLTIFFILFHLSFMSYILHHIFQNFITSNSLSKKRSHTSVIYSIDFLLLSQNSHFHTLASQ